MSETITQRGIGTTIHNEMKPVGVVYVDGHGNQHTTYREDISLEEYVDELSVVLGVPKGTIQVSLIDSYDKYTNGNATKVKYLIVYAVKPVNFL